MNNHSAFEKIVGNLSEDKKEKLLLEKKEIFSNQNLEEIKGKEKLKTPEEMELISLANQATNEIRNKYGLDNFDIPPNNIHIIEENFWVKKYKENTRAGAIYLPKMQAVLVPEVPSPTLFFIRTFHEMIHFKSYNALQITNTAFRGLEIYRLGLMVVSRDKEDVYFTNLNEAVTEKMTMKYASRFFNNPLISSDVEQKKNYVKEHHLSQKEAEEIICVRQGKNSKDQPEVYHWGYPTARKILDNLIDKLFEKNNDKFQNRDEVFEVFEKSAMTGNLLPIGRLIDGTFGRGTLHELSNLDKDIKAQLEFVNLL